MLKRRTVVSNLPIQEASIGATVIRCGCGDPATIHPAEPCPTPRSIRDMGNVSYWHKNPLRRAVWTIKQAWREGRTK